jgi:hypothetical protein
MPKIYKLEGGGKFYYGSTNQHYLCNRKYKHKQDALKYPGRPMYKFLNAVGWDNVTITLIEEVSNEMRWVTEDKYIREALGDPNCLNTNVVIVTLQEQKEKRKLWRKTSEKHKKTRRANRTTPEFIKKRNEYNRLKTTCECGAIVSKSSLARHKKNVRHKTFEILGK